MTQPTCGTGYTFNATTSQCVSQSTAGSAPTTDVTVAVAQGAVISAPQSNGVDLRTAGSGAITVSNAGTILAGNVGILANSDRGAITITNSGQITAPVGIAAGSTAGVVSITNSGRIDGATVGIVAASNARVDVKNEVGGQITFGQLGLAGVSASTVTLTNNGTLTQDTRLPSKLTESELGSLPALYRQFASTPPAAIFGRTFGSDLTVSNAGAITGARGIDAAVLPAQNGAVAGQLVINNLAGGSISTTGAAIETSASRIAARVSNAGTINGPIRLSDGSSFVNESGGRLVVRDSSTFGGGTVTNLGSISLSPGGPGTGIENTSLSAVSTFENRGSVSFAVNPAVERTASATISAGTFTNAGVIALQTNTVGNTLTINGNYVGQNGTLLANFSAQDAKADQLIINGNASGTTTVNVTNVGAATAFTKGAPVVTVNGSTAQNAFTLGQTTNFGTLKVQLTTQTNESGSAFTIAPVATPNAAGEQGATANVAARTIASQGTTAILDRVTQVRQEKQSAQAGFSAPMQYAALVSKDPIAAQIVVPAAPVSNVRPAVFARAFGDFEHRSGISALGNDLGYNQSTGGLVGGADAVISGLTSAQDGVILGAFGGYTVARVQLARGMGHQFYEGGSVGAYATYLNGGFFADTLFKADLLGLDIRSPMVRQDTGLQNYSWLGNIGYRFDVGRALYLEPTAGLEYVATNFNRNPTGTVSTVPLQDGDALRGRIGARLGTEFVENNVRYEPSITALVYDVFSETGNTATFGGVTAVTGLKNVGKIRGEVQTAMNFFNLATGWSGFLRADYRVGSDLVGAGGRAGMRYQW